VRVSSVVREEPVKYLAERVFDGFGIVTLFLTKIAFVGKYINPAVLYFQLNYSNTIAPTLAGSPLVDRSHTSPVEYRDRADGADA
jgi:hypothetical protein